MKKLLAITGAVLAVYLLLTATVAPPAAAPEETAAQAEIQDGWLVCEQDGCVAVLQGGETVLLTDTRVTELPKSDQSRLHAGIYVNSDKELKALLEDLCS